MFIVTEYAALRVSSVQRVDIYSLLLLSPQPCVHNDIWDNILRV